MSQGMGPGPGTAHSAGGGGIAFVQGGAWVTNSTSATFTFGNNTGASNIIILLDTTATGVTPTITNTQSLTFTQIQTYINGNAGTNRVYCASGTSTAALSITSTATQSAMVAAEFSGASCTTDGSNSANSVSGTPDSGDITTTNAADLLIGSFLPDRTISTFANTVGFTDVAADTTFGTLAYKIVGATGTYHYTGTCGGGTCPAFYGAGIVAVH